MKKPKVTKSEALAQWAKEIYDAFLMAGFSTDQAFQLLLEVIKKEKV
jgi:hypothetical protein